MALVKVKNKENGRILMVNAQQAQESRYELVIEKPPEPKTPETPETPKDPPKPKKKDLKGTKVQWTDSKGEKVTGTFEGETDDPNIISVKKDGAKKTQKISADKVTFLNEEN